MTKFRVFEVLALKDLLRTSELDRYRYVVAEGMAEPNEGERIEEMNPFVIMPLQWDMNVINELVTAWDVDLDISGHLTNRFSQSYYRKGPLAEDVVYGPWLWDIDDQPSTHGISMAYLHENVNKVEPWVFVPFQSARS